MSEKEIYVDQLQVGLYIKLDLPWFSHPFMFNSFKIKNQEQIETIKSLGVEKVIYIPEKSDVQPLARINKKGSMPTDEVKSRHDQVISKEVKRKIKKIKELKSIKESLKESKRKYLLKVKELNNSFAMLLRKDEKALESVNELVKDSLDLLLSKSNLVIHLLSEIGMETEDYNHALNVMVLSMLIGKEMGLSEEKLKYLALGAVFHDIGKLKIEKKYWRKPISKMTKFEKNLVKIHPKYGVELLSSIKPIPKDMYDAIFQHHERNFGGGYPIGIKGDEINELAKIITLSNIFDKLCNPYDVLKSISAYEALKMIYRDFEMIVDFRIFDILVKVVGVYPPGTIVRLSNDKVAKVVTVRLNHMFRPSVLVYDPDVPKKDAALFDLMENKDVRIEHALSLRDLDEKIIRYLDIGTRINYTMDSLEKT